MAEADKGAAMPPPDRMETTHGTLCFALLTPRSLQVTCGREDGWFRFAGRRWFVVQNWKRGPDGWSILGSEGGSVRVALEDGKYGAVERSAMTRAVLARVEDETRRWLAERARIVTLADLEEMRSDVRDAAEELAGAEARLETARRTLAARQAALAEAEASAARSASGGEGEAA